MGHQISHHCQEYQLHVHGRILVTVLSFQFDSTQSFNMVNTFWGELTYHNVKIKPIYTT